MTLRRQAVKTQDKARRIVRRHPTDYRPVHTLLRIDRGQLNVASSVTHCHLWSALQVSGSLGTLAHNLYRLQYVRRLVVIGVAQITSPRQVPVHLCQHLRKRC